MSYRSLASLEQQPRADSRQLKILLALIESSWVPAPPHTHIHTLFIVCQRSLSQTCFRTAARVREAGSGPAYPERTGKGLGLFIVFVPPGVGGKKWDDLHFGGNLGPNQFGA